VEILASSAIRLPFCKLRKNVEPCGTFAASAASAPRINQFSLLCEFTDTRCDVIEIAIPNGCKFVSSETVMPASGAEVEDSLVASLFGRSNPGVRGSASVEWQR
jgi:hypothetical protein